MNKLTLIIKKINTFLNNQRKTDSPAMRKIAREFAGACSELNKILYECGTLLANGKVIEAVEKNHSVKPTVLERAMKLDIVGFDQWIKICKKYSWEVPVQPSREVIRKLENACNMKDEFFPLLKNWQQIADDKNVSIITEKLAILRELNRRSKDKTWMSLIREQEKLYHNELLKRAKAAIEDDDLNQLAKICQEMKSPELSVPPDKKSLAEIEKLLQEKKTHSVHKKAVEILKKLEAAYMLQVQT